MCGLKLPLLRANGYGHRVTPHVGVWIETDLLLHPGDDSMVTPHVGVWIETRGWNNMKCQEVVTPHVGVWIETLFGETPYKEERRHTSCRCVD